jgi:8-oxo-dGTP pyrophosphatase MutT (NUDIX family)
VEEARAGGKASLGLTRRVRAAGGIVARQNDSGGLEVLLVHRPRYDDWTFPKGKCDGAESDEECALREVEEETGFRCRLQQELASTKYRDSHGRRKTVRYWAMAPVDGLFAPTHEVDEVRWLSPNDASGRLSYDRDRDVLASLEAA